MNRTEQNRRCYEQTISPPQPREHRQLPNLGHFGKIRPQDECSHADFLSPTSSVAIIWSQLYPFFWKCAAVCGGGRNFWPVHPNWPKKGRKHRTVWNRTEQKQTEPPMNRKQRSEVNKNTKFPQSSFFYTDRISIFNPLVSSNWKKGEAVREFEKRRVCARACLCNNK